MELAANACGSAITRNGIKCRPTGAAGTRYSGAKVVFAKLCGALDAAIGDTVIEAMTPLATIQMIEVSFPTTDGGCLLMPRYTEPEADVALFLHQLGAEPRVWRPSLPKSRLR